MTEYAEGDPAAVAAEEATVVSPLRGLISSDINDLDRLQKSYNWIPSSSSIRPAPVVLEAKQKRLEEIVSKFDTMRDYILSTVFMKPTKKQYMTSKLYATDEIGVADMKIFAPNEFPYNLESGNHYVMWYGVKPSDVIDKDPREFSHDINAELAKMLGADANYDYAYYVNPKMTVPEFFHLQVFWIRNGE